MTTLRSFSLLILMLFVATGVSAGSDEKRPGWIGASLAQHRESPETNPTRTDWLVVRGLEPGGPAERAGLQMMDIVVAIDGKQTEFENLAAVLRAFDAFRPGKALKFTVARGTARMTVTIVPEPMTESQYQQWKSNRAKAQEIIARESAMNP